MPPAVGNPSGLFRPRREQTAMTVYDIMDIYTATILAVFVFGIIWLMR